MPMTISERSRAPVSGTDRPKIAFLGTGRMGGPMARRVMAAGYSTSVWNRSSAKAEVLRSAGGLPCATPAEAAEGAIFICLCLTDADALEAVLFGRHGVVESLSPAATIIDFSTVGVARARSLAARLDATWLDCPVSGGVAGAEAGALTILAGGDAAALKAAAPLLDCVATRVTRMGDVGAGQAAKLCNQLIVATNLLAIAEAIFLGELLGVEVVSLPSALQGGFADSLPLQLFGPRMAAERDPGPAVSELRTMRKDIDVILAAGRGVGAVLPLLERVDQLYADAIRVGLSEQDLPALMRLYRNNTSQEEI